MSDDRVCLFIKHCTSRSFVHFTLHAREICQIWQAASADDVRAFLRGHTSRPIVQVLITYMVASPSVIDVETCDNETGRRRFLILRAWPVGRSCYRCGSVSRLACKDLIFAAQRLFMFIQRDEGMYVN